ncbi:hypothetical protein ACFX2J_035041 [Malus domestica]
MGLCDAWVNVVIRYVSFVQFSVFLNGQPGKKFKPLRGLRQGDALSPYLFLLLISLQKSTVYFSANTPVTLAQELSVNLEMPVMEDIGMYLGVITVWGRSKYDALTYIKDRVLAKIMGWKQQFISQQCWRLLHESDSL